MPRAEYGDPVRTVRVPANVWEPAKRRAAADGRTISDAVRELLEQYADDQVQHTCDICGERFALPRGVAVTRGSRPCGWSH